VAISLKTAGTWARMVTDGGTVAIPGTPAAGDRMLLFGTWKTYTITVATPNGWNPIGAEFADGTTAAGNGTGSMKVRAFYRDWQSGDAAPAIDYSAAPTEGFWVVMLWQKAGGDTWATPLPVTAAITAVDPWSATASATVDVPDASVVMELIGLRDDSTTIARSATTALEDDGSPNVTWNGNYVESPATHISSTTGQDAAADLGHRFVTTGAAGVSLTSTGDPVAAETGAVLWVVQGLFVSDPKTATPDVINLTTATFAPVVTASDHQTATPSTLVLTTATFAPTVTATQNITAVPDVAALNLATFAPTVTATDHKTVTPDTAALTTTGFAPVVTASDHQIATPATLALTLATFAPTVSASDNIVTTPGVVALNLATFAPDVSVGGGSVSVTPDTLALIVTTYAPTVATGTPAQPSTRGGVPFGAAKVVGRSRQRVTKMGQSVTLIQKPSGPMSDDPEELWLLGLQDTL